MFELGLDTFGDVTLGANGKRLPQHQVLRDVVEEAVLADELGLTFFGVGEHHRDDFAVSAPEVVLGAIASRTKSIHLGSAVTVLSTDDAVRVFERFSTVDALSSGRAEVILGRGSFTESYPLFGFDLNDYERLFEEKLQLFVELLKEKPLKWKGSTRAALDGEEAFPPTASGRLKTWVGVGGTPNSILRAARHGLPLMLAIIGGDPLAFAGHADLYRRALAQAGHEALPIGAHSPGYVAATDVEAKETAWPHHAAMHARIGAERGWPAMKRSDFEHAVGPTGAVLVGSPETVAAKIVRAVKGLGLARFDMKYSMGTLPHDKLMKSIELYAMEVRPLVEAELAG
ncbi:MAG TPA: LLM class flavin-dependent oxidoreductase [Candidatus Polarisedimenticolaceae bacterium]|nr:LLM class flavin-dependent oxidoreductase [Candidatus Polarisedimenticolaceae bacterium]